MDETLLSTGKLARLLLVAAKILFKLSLLMQRPNRKLIEKLQEYDNIIILTARGEGYRKITERQLRRHGIPYNQLIMCNYQSLIFRWKKAIVKEIKPRAWIDDLRAAFKGVEGY